MFGLIGYDLWALFGLEASRREVLIALCYVCVFIFASWQEFDTVTFLPDDSGLVAQFGNSGLKIHSTRYFFKYYIKTFLRFLPFFGPLLTAHPMVILPCLIFRKKTPSKVLERVQDPWHFGKDPDPRVCTSWLTYPAPAFFMFITGTFT